MDNLFRNADCNVGYPDNLVGLIYLGTCMWGIYTWCNISVYSILGYNYYVRLFSMQHYEVICYSLSGKQKEKNTIPITFHMCTLLPANIINSICVQICWSLHCCNASEYDVWKLSPWLTNLVLNITFLGRRWVEDMQGMKSCLLQFDVIQRGRARDIPYSQYPNLRVCDKQVHMDFKSTYNQYRSTCMLMSKM